MLAARIGRSGWNTCGFVVRVMMKLAPVGEVSAVGVVWSFTAITKESKVFAGLGTVPVMVAVLVLPVNVTHDGVIVELQT